MIDKLTVTNCNLRCAVRTNINDKVISMAIGVQVSYVVTWLINKWH